MSIKNTAGPGWIRALTLPAIIAVVVFSGTGITGCLSHAGVKNDTISLFNGHDLNDWVIVLKDSLAPPDSTFFVSDGVIRSTGTPFGYVRTKDKYANYHLSLEWRWPQDPGNSGVFLHVNNDKVFPECLECQLFHDHAGDFIAMGDLDFSQRIDKNSKVVNKLHESSEKPTGEWNRYDIRVMGDSVSISVNGVLQNVASHLNRTSGWIALQSEGAGVEFRNVNLVRED